MEGVSVGAVAEYLQEHPLTQKRYAAKSKPTAKPSTTASPASELNDALYKVQKDIKRIKDEVLTSLADPNGLDYEKVKQLFDKAELDIQNRKQDVVSKFNYQSATVPSNIVLETPSSLPRPSSSKPPIREEKTALSFQIANKVGPNTPSPGAQNTALQRLKAIINPVRNNSRDILHQHYAVPLPGQSKTKEQSVKHNKPMLGSTLSSKRFTKTCQSDPRTTPATVTEDDSKSGVFNLIERKLIPATAELNLEPSPIKHKQARLHSPLDPYRRNMELAESRPCYNLSLVKFDEKSLVEAVAKQVQKKKTLASSSSDRFIPKDEVHNTSNEEFFITSRECIDSMPSGQSDQTILARPTPAATEATDKQLTRATHKFVIQNGSTRSNSQDFMHFKRYYILSWDSISSLLERLEKLMTDYSVPLALVDGDRLADLALYFEAGPLPTIKDLLMCVLNGSDVAKIIMIPGRRYIAADGRERAAIKIQATYRCHYLHAKYLAYRRQKWAAGIIALSWIMQCKMTMMKKQLKLSREENLSNFHHRAKIFQGRWKRLQQSKRVIIHIPSLGHCQEVRNSFENIALIQNKQMGRICDIRDPNVEVIYVCPVEMNDEMRQYYSRLIDVMSAVTGQNSEELNSRLKIITPSAHDRFPSHNMCLSTLLMYSIPTLKRIQSMIQGKEAYIVPGMMHIDDLAVADRLGIPICGPEPEVAQLYSRKSGARRIFEKCKVSVPPGEHDIFSFHQLRESLARLVTENLQVKRWLFKIDNEFAGRGTAFCDVTPYLSCHSKALKEAERYGDKWINRWAHEPTFQAIFREIGHIIETYATLSDNCAYSNWREFLETFLKYGGLIEASPPTESVTSLTANIFIEPGGTPYILSIVDQIHSSSSYSCWGYSIPQASVEPVVINGVTLSIAEACQERGMTGYMSINYITFIDPINLSQVVWAVDMDLQYSTSHSMLQFLTFMADADLSVDANTFRSTVTKHLSVNTAYQSKRRKTQPSKTEIVETLDRYCVFSSNLFHSNLNNIHYNVFFQMCKAHGIGFDSKLKVGTGFTLIDHVRRESIGMMTMGESLQSTLWNFMKNLETIHDEISSPIMNGSSNFQGAINDIKGILQMMQMNLQIDQSEVDIAQAYQEDDKIERTSPGNEANTEHQEEQIKGEKIDTKSSLFELKHSPTVTGTYDPSNNIMEGNNTVDVGEGIVTNSGPERTLVIGPIDGRLYSSPVSPRPEDDGTSSVDSHK